MICWFICLFYFLLKLCIVKYFVTYFVYITLMIHRILKYLWHCQNNIFAMWKKKLMKNNNLFYLKITIIYKQKKNRLVRKLVTVFGMSASVCISMFNMCPIILEVKAYLWYTDITHTHTWKMNISPIKNIKTMSCPKIEMK